MGYSSSNSIAFRSSPAHPTAIARGVRVGSIARWKVRTICTYGIETLRFNAVLAVIARLTCQNVCVAPTWNSKSSSHGCPSRGTCIARWPGAYQGVPDTIGRAPVEAVPEGVDYNLWTGPAPMKSFTQNRFHYKWHWLWDTGNGDLGNQRVHRSTRRAGALACSFRCASPRWAGISCSTTIRDAEYVELRLPVRSSRRASEEAGDESPPLNLEQRGGDRAGLFSKHNSIGSIFYGSKGYLAAGNEDPFSYESWLGTDQSAGPHGKSGNDHFANFINCVRSRNAAELRAPIEEGHVSCALVHLANASYRLGRSLPFDPATELVVDDEEANRILAGEDRGYREPFVMPAEV